MAFLRLFRVACLGSLFISVPGFAGPLSMMNHFTRETARILTSRLDSGVFSQQLDHFDTHNKSVFSERFAIYTDFAGKDVQTAPVFYYFCGEWTCTESDSLSGVPQGIARYAEELGAVLVIVEHRYYGKSKPFSDLSPEHMKYLTYEQALQDFSDFEKYAVKTYHLDGKWISVGGSYSGALSAYYRELYPDQVVGALSSSGVVKTVTAFEDYDRMVAEGLGPECLTAVQTATHAMEASLGDPVSFKNMKKLFLANDISDPRDLLSIPANAADLAVQYGNEAAFCSNVLSTDPVHGLARASINAKSMIPHPGSEEDSNSWMYQMCTQFGGFTIPYHDPNRRVASVMLDLDYSSSPCKKLFGITKLPSTDETNRKFYDPLMKPSTSHIVYVNGSTDPYSVLSVTNVNRNNTNPNTESDMIEGGSHCIDFQYFAHTDNDVAERVSSFQSHFYSIAKEWLK